MTCHETAIAASGAYLFLVMLCIAAYLGWRRLSTPWRSASFVLFVLLVLGLLDVTLGSFALTNHLNGPTPSCT